MTKIYSVFGVQHYLDFSVYRYRYDNLIKIHQTKMIRIKENKQDVEQRTLHQCPLYSTDLAS